MTATLRAKMRVQSVTQNKKASDGSIDTEQITLVVVTADSSENKQWSQWTPNGSMSLIISNPNAIGKVSNGHEFYVDLIPVSQGE